MRVSRLAALFCCFWLYPEDVAAQVPLNPVNSRSVGHAKALLVTSQPNLVEGRELNNPQGVVVDTSGGERILYVADTGNNRVLGWRNASSLEGGREADIVLGQRDKLTTLPQGPGVPGSNFASGLNTPSGVGVDAQGNVYVADAGNNRIIRYPRPTAQPDEIKLADMVIGQSSFTTRTPNTGGLSERSLALNVGSNIFQATPVFDSQGNLWMNDAGNNRILRYPASALGEGASNGPAATLVLGQPDFRSNASAAVTTDARVRGGKSQIRWPGIVALDQGGRLYVPDQLNRVLVYTPPFTNGKDAARIIGLVPAPAQGQQPPPGINEYSVGVFVNNQFFPPSAAFTIGNVPFVVDTPAHRILRFDPFDQWPAETATEPSPRARAIIGQDTIQQTEIKANRGLAEPNANSYLAPAHAVFAAGETWVADSGNSRVLVLGDISTGPPLAASAPYNARRVVGQLSFEFRAPNLIDGREFFFGQTAGIVIDGRSSPPRLYVADSANNRVLGFSNALKLRQGDKADLVIGQIDFFRSVINFPSGDVDIRNNSGLANPTGLAVDAEGNLWVADTANGRVLRFPSPFDQRQRPLQADIVLGQSNFTVRQTDATARTMSAPYGLAFTAGGSLLVSDAVHNRVLLFNPPFSSGIAAARVFGQPDFNSTGVGNADNRFNGLRHISTDTDDRLYICDQGNNRVVIFSRAPLAGVDPRPAFTIRTGINQPIGLFVSPHTGEIWVGNNGATESRRYPQFDRLSIAGDASDYLVQSLGPLAMTLDAFGNLYVADRVNRVAIHYPTITAVNAASRLPRVTPGMYATLDSRQLNYTFTEETKVFSQVPMERELGGIQVLLDGTPAPIHYASPNQINFVVPNNAPTSGTVELEVVQPATGRVVASSLVRMDVASPALFTLNGVGTGQVAALNEDGSFN
jgi:sugar lactone lactonase YvrE